MGVITGTRKTEMNPTNGKGDRYRRVDDKKYNTNWDRIFGNVQDQEENAKDVPEDFESFGQEKI